MIAVKNWFYLWNINNWHVVCFDIEVDMKNKLISLVCSFGLIFSAFGKETRNANKLQFEEINQPEEQQKEYFSLSDLFSNLNSTHREQKKTVKAPKDYFAEDFQAFAEDDPWDKQ